MTEGQVSEENSSGEATKEVSAASETQEQAPKEPTKPNTNDSINASLEEIDDVDTLRGMVRALRAENANHRRKSKSAADEVEGLKAWKLQNLKAVSEAEEKAAKADQVSKRYILKAAALEYDVDDDLIDLINGETEDEIWAKAEKLANTKKKQSDARNPLDPGWVPGPTNLMAGKRGNPLTGKPEKNAADDGSWLKQAWDRS